VVLVLVQQVHMLLERKELTQHFQPLLPLEVEAEALLVALETSQLLVVQAVEAVCVCKHHLMAQAQQHLLLVKVLQVETQQHLADTLAVAVVERAQ
jgi:hypothetical protein